MGRTAFLAGRGGTSSICTSLGACPHRHMYGPSFPYVSPVLSTKKKKRYALRSSAVNPKTNIFRCCCCCLFPFVFLFSLSVPPIFFFPALPAFTPYASAWRWYIGPSRRITSDAATTRERGWGGGGGRGQQERRLVEVRLIDFGSILGGVDCWGEEGGGV